MPCHATTASCQLRTTPCHLGDYYALLCNNCTLSCHSYALSCKNYNTDLNNNFSQGSSTCLLSQVKVPPKSNDHDSTSLLFDCSYVVVLLTPVDVINISFQTLLCSSLWTTIIVTSLQWIALHLKTRTIICLHKGRQNTRKDSFVLHQLIFP